MNITEIGIKKEKRKKKKMENDEVIKLFDKNELRRLEKAAKDKNKTKVAEWGKDFERRLSTEFNKKYRDKYINELKERLKDLDVAVMFALHFNENTKFGNKRLKDFMDDLAATMRGFYKDDFDRAEYKKMLEDDGINLDEEDL